MSPFMNKPWQEYHPPSPGRPWKEFSQGFGYLLKGYRFIREHPGLWRYALPSILLYLPVFFVFLAYFPTLVYESAAAILDFLKPLWEIWYWQVLLVIGSVFILLPIGFLVIIILVSLVILATLVASVFNDLLAEKTEALSSGSKYEVPFSIRRILRDSFIVMKEELKKLGFYFFVQGIFFIWSLVPLVGPIVYLILGGGFSVLFLGFEYLDYPLARRLVPFGEKRSLVARYGWRMFGFGSAVSLSLLIPIFNAFAMALAVIGAALFFVDLGVYQADKEK